MFGLGVVSCCCDDGGGSGGESCWLNGPRDIADANGCNITLSTFGDPANQCCDHFTDMVLFLPHDGTQPVETSIGRAVCPLGPPLGFGLCQAIFTATINRISADPDDGCNLRVRMFQSNGGTRRIEVIWELILPTETAAPGTYSLPVLSWFSNFFAFEQCNLGSAPGNLTIEIL